MKKSRNRESASWIRNHDLLIKLQLLPILIGSFNAASKDYGGTARHRGSVRASHPAVPGSIRGILAEIFIYSALIRESGQCKSLIDRTI